MNKRLLIIVGILVLFAILAAVFFFWKKPVSIVQDTGSAVTLPVSEDEILIPDPSYYLSRAQPYFQELESAINKKDYITASQANEKIHGFLTKMEQVSVVQYAKDQVIFLINASVDIKDSLSSRNDADIKKALENLRMMKVLQFQSQKGGIGTQ
ncbi:MAG: hypothetical protein ACK4NC_06070 [Candidatus Gracilibacteria bacterium]